jgi:hypothetical protein
MKIHQLVGGKYSEVKIRPALPVLTGEVLTGFLQKLKTSDQYEVLLDFEKWLDNQ